jgi:hypothetical protein
MSGEPLRILNDPSLPAALRDDVAALSVQSPRYDVERGLARLTAAIATSGAVAPSSPPEPAPASPRAAAGTAPASSVAAMVCAVSTVLASLLVPGDGRVDRRVTSPPVTVAAPVSIPADLPVATPPPAPSPLPASPSLPQPAPRAKRPKAPALPRAKEASSWDAMPPAAASPALAPPKDGAEGLDMDEEIRLQAKLRTTARTDPQGALALIEESKRRFPDTVFAQERAYLEIQAMAKVGRLDEARAGARQFITKYPKHPAVAALRALLQAGEQR